MTERPMTPERERMILERSLDYYGQGDNPVLAVNKLFVNLGEIFRLAPNSGNRDHIIHEIAAAQLTLEQLALRHDCAHEVRDWREHLLREYERFVPTSVSEACELSEMAASERAAAKAQYADQAVETLDRAHAVAKYPIAAVLKGRVELAPKDDGDTLWGPCPFCKEETPSFAVYPAENRWHCFGCGAGGYIIGLVMRLEGLNFREAVEWLEKKMEGETGT